MVDLSNSFQLLTLFLICEYIKKGDMVKIPPFSTSLNHLAAVLATCGAVEKNE